MSKPVDYNKYIIIIICVIQFPSNCNYMYEVHQQWSDMSELEPCMGQVNPYGLRVPEPVGWVENVERVTGWVRVEDQWVGLDLG